jgi:nucleoside-diphosphate-sugar epimerase
MVARVLVLGASGRLGSMLRRYWTPAQHNLAALWQMRPSGSGALAQSGPDIVLCDPLRSIPDCGPVDVVLGLAGVVPGRNTGDLALNSALGLAALRCGAALGARHVFLSSSAAVYGGAPQDLTEADALSPTSPYGQSKLAMEHAVLTAAAMYPLPVTALRIGNVAGADALLGPVEGHIRGERRVLDQFADGQGPVRSYIGPCALADLLARLVVLAARGTALPARLNLALKGAVAMADLCEEAGLTVAWRPAPPQALPRVVQDVTQLARLVPVPRARARAIIADWHADRMLVPPQDARS